MRLQTILTVQIVGNSLKELIRKVILTPDLQVLDLGRSLSLLQEGVHPDDSLVAGGDGVNPLQLCGHLTLFCGGDGGVQLYIILVKRLQSLACSRTDPASGGGCGHSRSIWANWILDDGVLVTNNAQ